MGDDGVAPTSGYGTLSERRARTVESILSAAMLIVAEEGIAALSMSTLASRAGVSRQTLYTYFPDVDAVLAAMVEMGDTGTAELADRMLAEDDARAAVRVFVSAAVESARSGHPSPMAMTAALPADMRAAMQAHEERAERLVIDLLRRGMRDRVFRADLDPELDGRILYRAALAGSELAHRGDVDAGSLTERLSADLLRMVALEPTASARS